MKLLVVLFTLLCAALPAWALPSGTLVYEYANYKHIATNTTTVVKASPGLLSFICVNTVGASSNLLTVYDNASAASGTAIAIIDTTAGRNCWRYGVGVLNGITVLTATGTAADVTVGWR